MNTALINNQIDISNLDKFAAIIGENPSSGARSPKLWNSVFKNSGLNYSMVPMDVCSDNLFELLDSLEQDSNFIGGAVAVPYKERVADWLGKSIMPEAKKIGAVNCLFREDDGSLKGTNTDGEGALFSFKEEFGDPVGKNILLLGTGGAAKAVAAYFASKDDNTGRIWLCGRNDHGKNYSKIINVNWILWRNIDNILNEVDVVINCTSIGFGDQKSKSPLSVNQVQRLKKASILFDIVYQPLETNLLKIAKKRGISTINGLKMNLEQAVLAYQYAVKSSNNSDEIRKIMSQV